jgi:hypothetical protein
MKLKIVVDEYNYFKKLLALLNNIPPFNKIRPKELELYALLMYYNHKYRKLPFEDRNIRIFHNKSKKQMAEELNIEVSGVYNLMKGLRDAGIIKSNLLIAKYILPKTKSLIFSFVYETDE